MAGRGFRKRARNFSVTLGIFVFGKNLFSFYVYEWFVYMCVYIVCSVVWRALNPLGSGITIVSHQVGAGNRSPCFFFPHERGLLCVILAVLESWNSCCRPGWAQRYRDPPASAFQMLGSKVWDTNPVLLTAEPALQPQLGSLQAYLGSGQHVKEKVELSKGR